MTMRALLFVWLALAFALLTACGGEATPPPVAPSKPAAYEPAPLPRALGKPRMTVEYVVIHKKWVEKTMTPNASDVTAWYETGEGKSAVPQARVLHRFDSKKKAEAAVLHLKKNESVFDGLVDTAQFREDPPIVDAFAKLAPGDAVVVQVDKDFFAMKKQKPTEEAIERAYKKAKAPEATQKLAAAILDRLKKPDADARAIIAEVASEVLGDRAVADPDRPAPVLVDDDRLRHARLPPKAKDTVEVMLKTAKAGDTVPAPIVDGDTTTIARAVPPADR